MSDDRDTLIDGEPHPAAYDAMAWLQTQTIADLCKWKEAFASCAIENNRLAAICLGTLNRIEAREPVSDRYLLGLVYTMKHKHPDDIR